MPDWRTLIKYGVVGASGVVVNTGVLYSLTEYVGLYYMMSAVIASELSIISNFVLNDTFTFSVNDAKHTKVKRFIIYNGVSVIGTAVLLGVTYLLTEYLSIYYIYASWFGVISVFIINYVLNKRITWGKNDVSL
jgi:dolichol-phosphate mannosyltransferase